MTEYLVQYIEFWKATNAKAIDESSYSTDGVVSVLLLLSLLWSQVAPSEGLISTGFLDPGQGGLVAHRSKWAVAVKEAQANRLRVIIVLKCLTPFSVTGTATLFLRHPPPQPHFFSLAPLSLVVRCVQTAPFFSIPGLLLPLSGLPCTTMASPAIKKAISEAASQYLKPEGKVFQYGTAGVCQPSHSIPTSLSRPASSTDQTSRFAVPHEGVSNSTSH